ncbi:hypothetical protein PEV8663_00981 [Pelagimonas varians]|uniref:Transposase IS116/IS110/IS902 family protein n=1 Tax=Pelagimonas varians TaxID=696760 RepID=A0A238K2T8_9RHOB|nr:hypothetical protein PEV8663_00981 [Pelagimonas varians]
MVRQRKQLINGLRGMVAEFGVYIARDLARVVGFSEAILADQDWDLPDIANEGVHNLCGHLIALHARVRLLRPMSGLGAVTALAIMRQHRGCLSVQ